MNIDRILRLRRPPFPPTRHAHALALGTGALALALAGTAGTVVLGTGAPLAAATTMPGPPGPEGVPLEKGRLLAPASTSARGKAVDGIHCDAHEQIAYHVHTHLAVYDRGKLRPIPAGIGLVEPAVYEQTPDGPFYAATSCYYWLHVHAQDGIIHIESPTARQYSLGQFFDIWRQPLGPRRVASARGPLTIFVNGRRYRGNPRKIRLGSHVDIQIDVGKPIVRPYTVDWAKTQL
jgi:hypothetical protein